MNIADKSILFGEELEIQTGVTNSVLIGKGLQGNRLINSGLSNSFIVGFNSNIPTFIVHGATGVNTSGKVGIGTGFNVPDAKLEVADYQSVLNNKIAKFKDSDNRQIFLVPKLGTNAFLNNMCQLNDIGIIFSDGQGNELNQYAGLVIGPYDEGEMGIRIDKYGNVGINTSSYILDNYGVKKNVGDYSSFQVNGGVAIGYITPTDVNENGLMVKGGTAIGYNTYTITPPNGLMVNGVVGINTDINKILGMPATCKLAVNGSIYATEIWVKEYTNWPDYVFNNNYNLMPLSELENYIKKYNHLPDVPSKDEVAKEGVNVGEMNEILLKKIEELTLYIIELKKDNDKLNERFDNLNFN